MQAPSPGSATFHSKKPLGSPCPPLGTEAVPPTGSWALVFHPGEAGQTPVRGGAAPQKPHVQLCGSRAHMVQTGDELLQNLLPPLPLLFI